ncbi:MAG TPA: heme ABC transporter ATP-binding protein [Alphaproteobacteria bacterium]|nr:heme ABC transporter ATP-binding protein [Alphaproteobacteria bacterium]
MLAAVDIDLALDGHRILDSVSLGLRAGEFVAVLGPNGAGKSTLLAILSGIRKPDAGDVTLDGRPLFSWAPQALARKRAVLPQFSELNFGFRALEVVQLGRTPHTGQSSRKRDLDVAFAALEATEAAHLADRIYPTLSGGEKQRVQLARILAQLDLPAPIERSPDRATDQARYLLLDEPIASLDPAHQHATLKIARNAARQGAGVLAILHDFNLAAMYADRLVLMHRGQVAAIGDAASVLTPALIDTVFNLAVEVITHPHLDCPHIVPV